MDNISDILAKIGLSLQESKVYLALLELQEAQTGLLCRTSEIASSNIYRILDSLMAKGLVSYRVQNNIKVFMAAPPDVLNELFLEKQKNLEQERKQVSELVSNLKRRSVDNEPYSNYKYFEGIPRIKSMWCEINSSMSEKSVVKVHTAKMESYAGLVGFYNEHHKARVKNKVKEQIIFPEEDTELAKKRKDKHTEIKFMNLDNDAEWGVLDDLFFIQYVTSKVPRAFLIKDKIFAKTFEQVFDKLWQSENS